MWQSFAAKNFRCFSSVQIKDLARVDLIAGKNNTGKTALLEAMHLHAYPMDALLPFTISNFRGTPSHVKFDESVGVWLHYDEEPREGIELVSQNEQGVTRTLRIWLTDTSEARKLCPDAA